LIVIHIYKD